MIKVIDRTKAVRRLRVRRLDEHAIAQATLARAKERGCLHYTVHHGGTVANAYKYKADTETAVAVSDGVSCVVWLSRVAANKATDRGAAESCIPGSGDLWDGRVADGERRSAARNALLLAFEAAFTPLERLAAAAEERCDT